MTISIHLPEDALRVLGDHPEQVAAEVRLAAAMKLYELKRLSAREATELAGVPRVVFLARLGDYGIDTFDLGPDELAADLEAARAASR